SKDTAKSDSASVIKRGTGSGEPDAPVTRVSTVATRVVAGAAHRVYFVPLGATSTKMRDTLAPPLVFVGMVRASRFRAATMKISESTAILLVLVITFVTFASWPLLKFPNMRATE